MKLHLTGLLALFALTVAVCAPKEAKFDYHDPQSPPKPLPNWIKTENDKQVFIDQGQYDPRLKGLRTPPGLKVEIVADFPTVVNPVGMTFADDGSPYVLEWLPGGTNWNEQPEEFTYKDGSKRKVATMKKGVKDVVKVLQLNEEKGVYDEAKVIIEDELPSSILLHDGWVYLSGRGTVRRYRQSQPDGAYDVKQVIAHGFCGFHHHQVSGMTLGNDGWLYLTAGDDDNYVEGSDGSRATVLRTGAVFRCRPDGSKMHAYSMGYRNPYRDVAFDALFNAFHADNDNEDGSKFTGCRLMHVAEESDFGWRLFQGARCCRPDPVRGAVYGELPGKLPPLLKTGRGAPAGLLIYNETRLPTQYRGLLYYPDVFRKLIRAYKVEPFGATFVVTEEFEFMKSDDPLFRPCQMVIGPDGAIYIVDWRTDSGGAGQLAGDGKHGRIYRVTWNGTADQPALARRDLDSWDKLRRQSDADLLKALGAPDFSDRLVAQRELAKRGPRNLPALLQILDNREAALPARIAALGAVQSFWNDEVRALFIKLARDADPDLRRLAAEGLGLNCKPGDIETANALLQLLSDPDLAARRAIALAMGHIGGEGAADALVNTLKFDAENDPYLRDGLLRAIERVGKPGIDRLVALAESGVDKEPNLVIEAFYSLRSRAAVEALPRLLTYPHDSPTQRANLILSYNNYLLDPPIALTPLLDYLTAKGVDHPFLVKAAGVQVLSSGGQLKGDKAEAMLLDCLEQADPMRRPELIQIVEHSRVAKAAPVLAKLLASEKTPITERAAIVKALRALNDKSAVPALKGIVTANSKESPEAVQLRIEALRTLMALDAVVGREAALAFLDEKDQKLQGEGVNLLGASPEGAKLVGERFRDKKLPRELLPQVSDALRTHAAKNPELNKLLTEVMKGGLLLSLDKAEIERIEKLVTSRGDAKRGKALYLNGKTLACVNCHRLEGVGGNVGPDLTRVWETQSIEKLMEKMIEPSKMVKEGYQTWTATTKKGQTFKGLKVAQNADGVTLKEASGQEIRIAADLDELSDSKQSLMPDNVISQLKFEQFLDLVAFLKDRAAQESLRGMALEFWVVGPFAGDADAAHPPEEKPLLTAKYPGLKAGEELTWQPRQTEPSGLLNLRALFNRDQTTAYALTHVYSPKPQKVQMLIGASDGLKVWINNAVVHEHAARRPAKPDEDRIEVELTQGWNVVLVKVVGVGAIHGLFLRFTGAGDLRLALKPDGK